jgi:glycosyltransferase involved in cell wall biosynthesis
MHHQGNLPCETKDYFMPFVDFNTDSSGIMGQVSKAGRILYSFEARKRLSKLLDKYVVDIAHLHNIYHQISPSILHEFAKRKIPVVMTLHDYKMVCAAYNMPTDGIFCEACRGERYFEAIKRKCVKDSFVKSVLSCIAMYLHHKVLDIYDNIDIFISPSQFLKDKLEGMGFEKKIVHLPNFIDIKRFKQIKIEDCNENSVVYFGRLSPGKGLRTLLEAAKRLNLESDIIVNILGDGPIKEELEEKVKTENIDNVKFLGYMKGEKLYNELRKNQIVVIPSEWYENNPISILEAFALKKPVIGSRIGGIPELVKDGKTGYTFEPGNAEDLSEKIKTLLSDDSLRIKMGYNARRFVELEFNPEKHYQKLIKIYQRAMIKS